MKKRHLLAFAFFATICPVSAQEENLPGLVDKALAAMKAAEWEQARALNAEAIERFGGDNALETHGPQFGVLWFRKGVSELKLGKFEEAMKSFETSYKDFPNAGEVDGGGNIFNKMALLKWGEAAMGAGDYALAITQWKKFLEERNRARDNYPQGAFHISMAISHYRLGQIPEGNEHLQIAINNKSVFPTPNAAIVSGFQALVEAGIAAKNEAVILDLIAKNRGELILPPYQMHRFSKLFMKLAGDAIAAQMPQTALTLYQMVPATQVAINDLRSQIQAMGNSPQIVDRATRLDKATLEAELAALESEQNGGKTSEMIKLAAVAYLYETHKNVLGAYAAYLQLEQYHNKAEKREDNLYHLVRTSSLLGKVAITQKYGEILLNTFPESPHKPDVLRLMLSALFFEGNYEAAIEIAADIINNNKAEDGTPEHDLALFVLAGSYFYTGQYDLADPLLNQHVEKYPKSMFAPSAAYFQASNAGRLQFWAKAGRLLDGFLARSAEDANPALIPLALYDRANAHYSEDQPKEALEKIGRIIKEFPDSPVTDQAYNLRGNVHQGEGDLKKAETAYLKALELAEARGNNGVAGEALYYLITLLGDQPEGEDPSARLSEAVPYADKYWKQYAENSPYRAQVAVAQIRALDSVGRGDEGLEKLREVISTMAKSQEAAGLEAAINSYTEVYLAKHTPDELKEHYYNFPGISSQDRAARALLRIAVIGVFEQVAADSEDENKKRSANAMIQVLFQNLKTDFDLKDLSNYILVKLGDYLRANTSAPREAIPYYDEALSRQDQSHRFAALLGRADVYGSSDQEADQSRALEDLERIFADSQNKGEREGALFRIIEILMDKGQYEKAAARANEYLNREKGKTLGFSKYAPEVGLLLARSFEERGKIDDAIAMYVKVWSAHMGYIKVSAPAIKAWMQLTHRRNKTSNKPGVPSDRQGAYEGGHKYLELTGRSKDRFNPEELALWKEVQALVQQYVADPNVKSMEELAKEKAAAKR